MARFIISLAMVLFLLYASAQTHQDTTIYKTVEIMPEFPGGKEAFMAYLVLSYPPSAYANGGDLEGTAYIQFIIEADRQISNITVARSSGCGKKDKAALEHIKAMPPWAPGYQNGKPVRVQYIVPVKFKLR